VTRAAAVRALTAAQRRRVGTLAAVALVVFVALAIAARAHLLAEVDAGTHGWLQPLRHDTYPTFGTPVKLLGALGSGWTLAVVGGATCLAAAARDRRLAVLALAALAAAPIVQGAVKLVVAQRRPHLTAYGFPSGHVFGATIVFGLLVYLLWATDAPRAWRRLAAVLAAVVIAAVGGSRLYVNAHWLSDVMGGVAGGLAYLLGAVLVTDRRLRPPAVTAATPPVRSVGSG
jgi:membrane-associated phospholipid phosphatase